MAETIESILAQTYRPIEIIVVDDGSTDETPQIAARYERDVCYVRQDNAGPPSARNLGLSVARGRYVAFLDADDLWHSEKLASQMARFDVRPELDGSLTHIENFWSPDLTPEDHWVRDDKRPMILPGYSPITLLARVDAFAKFGQWDAGQRHAASTHWFVLARARGAILELLPEPMVRRRLHATNYSRIGAKQTYEEHLRLVKALLDARRVRDASAPTGE